jgi:four helix bundle protein
MALYTNLPVYKLGYDLLISIYEQTKLFSREHKYTLGERLKNDSLELLINIYKANKSKSDNRQTYIDVARQNAEVLRLLLRVSKDLQVISIKNFSTFNIKIEELSKQLASWHKYTAGAHAKESNS